MTEPEKVKCYFCAEEILVDAKKCRFCGEWVKSEQENNKTNNTNFIAPKTIITKKNAEPINNKKQNNNLKLVTDKQEIATAISLFILLAIFGGLGLYTYYPKSAQQQAEENRKVEEFLNENRLKKEKQAEEELKQKVIDELKYQQYKQEQGR